MRTVTITVPGEPVPLARHRHTRSGRTYRTKATEEYEERVRTAWMVEGRDYFGDVPIALRAVFTFERPPSHLKKNGELRKGVPRFPPRGDTSNLVKAVEDALNLHLYRDDAAIVSISASKVYGDEAKAELHFAAYD